LSRSGAAEIREKRSHVAAAREYAAIYEQLLRQLAIPNRA